MYLYYLIHKISSHEHWQPQPIQRDIGGKNSSKHSLKLMFMSSKMFGKVFLMYFEQVHQQRNCFGKPNATRRKSILETREEKKIPSKMSRLHYIRCKVNRATFVWQCKYIEISTPAKMQYSTLSTINNIILHILYGFAHRSDSTVGHLTLKSTAL